jgi:hypothetical protein
MIFDFLAFLSLLLFFSLPLPNMSPFKGLASLAPPQGFVGYKSERGFQPLGKGVVVACLLKKSAFIYFTVILSTLLLTIQKCFTV